MNNLDKLNNVIKELTQCRETIQERFTPGLYSREMFVPKGSVFISKIHKSEHQWVLAQGFVRVWTQKDGIKHYRAPHVGKTTPGTQRAVLVLEDTVWITFHPTEETDPAKIEEQIIQKPDEGSITISDEAMLQLTR